MRLDAHPTVEDLKVTLLESVRACGRHGLALLRVTGVARWASFQGVPSRETTRSDAWACPECVDERWSSRSPAAQSSPDDLVDMESGLSEDRMGRIALEWVPVTMGSIKGHIGSRRVIDHEGIIFCADTGKLLGNVDYARGQLTPASDTGWSRRSYYVLSYTYDAAKVVVDFSQIEMQVVSSLIIARPRHEH